jgi:hypothetical protein
MKVYNFSIIRGDDKFYILTFTDDDTGDPIDITGWTVKFTVKEDLDDTDANAIIKKEVTSHFDAANGKTKVQLTHDDTDQAIRNYYYDIQVKTAADEVFTIMAGLLVVKQDITQNP